MDPQVAEVGDPANRIYVPAGYKCSLTPKQKLIAIKDIKDHFESALSINLNLLRVTSPLFVRKGTGIQDDLNGWEKPVSFSVGDDTDGHEMEVVQSLAKWKRMALGEFGFTVGEGLYTDMNALRPDETIDNVHSVYVDQWDWELVIDEKDRGLELLKSTVRDIYKVLRNTERFVLDRHPQLGEAVLPKDITFVTTEEMIREYPDLSPKEREDELVEKYGAVFLIGIGGKILVDGVEHEAHDGRSPDYDDWSTVRKEDGGRGYNGDILVKHPVLGKAYELSSMGIRVNPETLHRQLEIRDMTEKKSFSFHRALLDGELPQTMGGGIGQSRLCMFFLRTAHIGEVNVSAWPSKVVSECDQAGVHLLK